MAKRVLGILRESTTRQEIDSQKKELTEFLLTKGFTEDEIEYIEAQGASARKANQQYKDFLENIKRTIEQNESIKTVGLWHLNRLGRIKKYLTDMEHYFVTNGIQMYVKNGFDMPLLGADGKETVGASIAFSVYAAMVEVETDELFEKTKRGKQRNEQEGKWNGGRLKIGYTVDKKDNKVIIDPETSEIVRDIFRLYVEENWSCKQIYDFYKAKGVFTPYRWKNQGYKQITSILRDERYTKGVEPTYKPFIPIEMQERALAMLDTRKQRKRSNNVYFCKGIIRDKNTGGMLNASRGTLVYSHLIEGESYNISINVLDYIAWLEARKIYIFKDAWEVADNTQIFETKITENNETIRVYNENIAELRMEIERAIEMNIRTPKYFPSEKLDKIMKENEAEISRLEKEISTLQQDNTRMKGALEANKTDSENLLRIKSENDEFFTQMTDEEKKRIIDSVIEMIEVERIAEKHYIIRIKQIIDITHTSVWEYYNTGHKIHLTEHIIENVKKDHTKLIALPENKHFIREDYWRRYYQPKKNA